VIKVRRWGKSNIPQEYLESISKLIIPRKIASNQESMLENSY